MNGRKIALQGLVGTGIMWAALIAYGLIHRGTFWPDAMPALPPNPALNFRGRASQSRFEAWESFILLCFIVEFSFTKAWAMWRRTRELDALGLSLILANVAYGLVFLWAVGVQVFAWETTVWVRRFVIREPLAIVLGISWLLLCRLPDAPEEAAEPETEPGDRFVREGPPTATA